MLPEIKTFNNKGVTAGLDKSSYYNWLFKEYLNLPDEECDNKITKYNLELVRVCNEYNEMKNKFLSKAHLIKEILLDGFNNEKYRFIIVKNLVEIMVSVKKQSRLMKVLKLKLKKQGVNKDWYTVLKYNIDKIVNRLIDLDKRSLDTAVEMTELGVFFKILKNAGIDPIEHIQNNIYVLEQGTYDNEEEKKKQQESLRLYIDNMHRVIKEDTTLVNKDKIIAETKQSLDRYVQFREGVVNKVSKEKQEYEDKANKDFRDACQVKLDNYCNRFKRELALEKSELHLVNEMHKRLKGIIKYYSDSNIIAEKYIVAVIRTQGKEVFEIKFISIRTHISLNKIPEKNWLKVTKLADKIRLLDKETVEYIMNNIDINRDKYMAKPIKLDNALQFKIEKELKNEDYTQRLDEYKNFLSVYNSKLDTDEKQLNVYDMDTLKNMYITIYKMINKYNKDINKINEIKNIELERVGVSIIGLKISKTTKQPMIQLMISKAVALGENWDNRYEWFTVESLERELNNSIKEYTLYSYGNNAEIRFKKVLNEISLIKRGE